MGYERPVAALILGAAAAAFGILAIVGRPAECQPGGSAPGGAFRNPEPVPRLDPAVYARPNVLMVLTEGARFDSVCVEPAPGCAITPFTDRVAKNRLPLLQMRATSSTTAISLAVILSGLPPTRAAHAVKRAPLLFDYARAAGYDAAYWSSQAFMFTHSPEYSERMPASLQHGRCVSTSLHEREAATAKPYSRETKPCM